MAPPGATYALGRLRLRTSAPRIREELDDPSVDVRLAAVWALGALGDAAAREPLARLLVASRRPGDLEDATRSVDGESPLGTDAAGRIFDATVQALRRLAHGAPDPVVDRALTAARGRLSDAELDRPALLPLFESRDDRVPTTVRDLFERKYPVGMERAGA